MPNRRPVISRSETSGVIVVDPRPAIEDSTALVSEAIKLPSVCSRPRIFAIDDDFCALEGLRLLVETRMGLCLTVFGPDKADEFCTRTVEERPDLVIIDQHMGLAVKGTDLLVRIRGEYCDCPVLMLSGDSDPLLQAGAIGLSANDFLLKPYASGDLTARIRTILRRHSRSPFI